MAREILDSRGNPTLEVEIEIDSSTRTRASIPSGASKGTFEAFELRDNDKSRYRGLGVSKSVALIQNQMAPFLKGKKISTQAELDSFLIELDGTENKSQFGANTILGVSLSFGKALALKEKKPLFKSFRHSFPSFRSLESHPKNQNLNPKPNLKGNFRLPIPLMNVLNGGVHANNPLDIQEFMIVPAFGDSFKEALRAGSEIFHSLKDILKQKNLSTAVGDEGGFAPFLTSHEEALELLLLAIEKAKYRPGEDIFLALDVASTEFHKENFYTFENKKHESKEIGHIYSEWIKKFPLISIEDPFSEDDWKAWSEWTKKEKNNIQIVGDDIFTTHPKKIEKGLKEKAGTALLVKMNQIGSLSETANSVSIAKKGSFKTVVSHRSGETEDISIAHLSVAFDCEQIKIGAPSRGERISKYNELLRIEEALGDHAEYWGYQGKKAFF